jgi:hypothetical protein
MVCARDTRELYAEGSARRCPKCARGVILFTGDMELKCEDQIVAGVIKRQQPGPEVSSRSLDSLLRGRAEFLRTGTCLFPTGMHRACVGAAAAVGMHRACVGAVAAAVGMHGACVGAAAGCCSS